jgi:hypothetical protein
MTDRFVVKKIFRIFVPTLLGIYDGTAREIRRMFAIWTSMLERKAGNHKFRIAAGAEIQGRRVSFHVFIGGVVPRKDFQEEWIDQWLTLGGCSAWLQKLDWPGVAAFLKGLSHDRHFEIKEKLSARPRIKKYS